jgi:ABC-type multidrug transport system fused ATPase/permease subunit
MQHSSIRENVDPFRKRSDESITLALQRTGLWELINDQGGLDMIYSDEFFSHGQRQLLCMARAMLRDGHIVVLDECTSSWVMSPSRYTIQLLTCIPVVRVDSKTDELMQDIIRCHFKHHTVVAITHRLETVLDFDRVIVMEDGSLIETGSPRELLSRPSGFQTLLNGNRSDAAMERNAEQISKSLCTS